MRMGYFFLVGALIGSNLVLGCHSPDENYFRRTTERRLEDLANAAAVLSKSHQPADMDELLTLAANDGLIPRGDGDALRRDAWGTAIRLERSDDGPASIRSAGMDRVFSTSDDIVQTFQ